MSRVMKSVILAAFVAASAGATAQVSAQAAPDSAEVLRARIDSLTPLLEKARRAVDERRAFEDDARRLAAAANTRVDTLRIADLTVLTPADQADETSELFREVWEESFAHLGGSAALARSVFAYQQVWGEPLPIHLEGGGHVLYKDSWIPRARVKRDVRRLIAGAASHDLRANRSYVGQWVRGNALDPVPWEDIYRQVATTSSMVTRACLAGESEACGVAMALTVYNEATRERNLELLAEWYTPEERRARVTGRFFYRRDAAALRSRCTETDDISACDQFLLQFSYDLAPLSFEVRESLVALALTEGGEGSWQRLAEHPGMTPTEALEYASGSSIDELLTRWQAELVANRPDAFEPLVPSSGRAFLWTLLFAALAMRSTRWRLG